MLAGLTLDAACKLVKKLVGFGVTCGAFGFVFVATVEFLESVGAADGLASGGAATRFPVTVPPLTMPDGAMDFEEDATFLVGCPLAISSTLRGRFAPAI